MGDDINVNVMIPKSVGHSDYTPQPRQIVELSHSQAYLAIGDLDFEITWRQRLIDASENNKWFDLDEGIAHESHEGCHHHDPHYWLSPARVEIMIDNLGKALKNIEPEASQRIDSAAAVLKCEVAAYDSTLHTLSERTFLIYHPALTCLAEDYAMTQLEIEHDGNAPSPQTLERQLKTARENNVQIVFVQPGYDIEKATDIAQQIGAKVVNFNPEDEDWPSTINIIIEALK